MNRALFMQFLRKNRVRVAAVSLGLSVWGLLLAVIWKGLESHLAAYASVPKQFTHFGSGDIGSFSGLITIGFEHPFALAMLSAIVVGTSAPIIAGQRQRGTLEMMLARPVTRTSLLLTATITVALLLVVPLLAMVGGLLLGTAIEGLGSELPVVRLPLVVLNALLLFGAFSAFGLAVSATVNRGGQAIGLSIGYLLLNYFIEVLGSLWEAAQPYQRYSLFHHFVAAAILRGEIPGGDLLLLAAGVAVPLTWAFIVLPRRDLPAP